MRYPGARVPATQPPARHAYRAERPGEQVAGPSASSVRAAPPAPPLPPRVPSLPPPAPPTTLSLVISRKARREAAALAEAASRPDPRIEVIEHVLTGLHVAANVYVLALSVIGWLWLAVQQPATTAASGAAQQAGHGPVQSLVNASGATLVLIMLATCLLMAPVVNPFYAPPDERRLLHTTATVLFGMLAVSTVAVIAGAAR